MNKKKLLYITNGTNGSGGLERVLSIKASELAEKYNYEVYIMGLNRATDHNFYHFSNKIYFENISVQGNFIKYIYSYITGIRKIVKKINPDVISVCDDGLKGFFVPLILQSTVSIIYERHASVNLNFNVSKKSRFSHIKNTITHKLMQFGAKHYHKVIVLTDSNKKDWQLNNILIIPNPVSFNAIEENTLQIKKIIVVGSQSYIKGTDLLLKIWKKIYSKHLDWSIDVYGKSDFENKYERMAKQMDIKNIHFHQPTQLIQEKYVESSIFLLPSRSEGFGMVIIEAMACGLPVISFNCPHGPADIISEGVDGFLIENGNIDNFVEKLELLIISEKLRKEMGKNALKKSAKFLPEKIMSIWDELFQELISQSQK